MNIQTAWRFAQIICLICIAVLTIKATAADARATAFTGSRIPHDVLKAQPTDPSVARGALREANTGLDKAVKSRDWKNLLKAVVEANGTITNIFDLNLQDTLKNELMATTKRLFAAEGLLLTLLKDSCSGNKRFEHGVLAARLLRSLGATSRTGIGQTTIQAVEKGLEACLRFELLISSRITNAELRYEVQVDITVPLRFNLKTGVLTGSGPIKKVAQSMKPDADCEITLTYTQATFEVVRMTIDVDISSKSGEAFIEDIKLSEYTPGPLNETMTTKCKEVPTVTGPIFNWGLLFLTIHDANNNMSIEDWTLGKPKNSVGLKTYEQKETSAPLDESSIFILNHRPAK